MSGELLLETERLLLSGWTMDQLPDLMRLHGDPRVSLYLTQSGAPWTEEWAAASLANWVELFETQRLGKLRLTRKSDGILVGRTGFGIHTPTGEPEMGYALYPEHWGNGYASEAASALRDWIFRETAWDHFIGMADSRNSASLKVLRGIGMIPTHVEPDGDLSIQFHILRKPVT